MARDQVVTDLYLEHLTHEDLAFLARFEPDRPTATELRAIMRSRRGGIEGPLDNHQVFEAIFGDGRGGEMLWVSPFLVFAVAVRWATNKLGSSGFVRGSSLTGRRALFLDAPRLGEFLSVPVHRFFLAELLASYARVASGSVLVATRRGLRRRRFSELDPVQLAGLLEVLPRSEHPGVLRRLGDLALFLTGVFPDYVARRGFGPVDQSRLRRLGQGTDPKSPGAARGRPLSGTDAVALLSELGQLWYAAAYRLLPHPVPVDLAPIRELPARFHDARCALTVVANSFLFTQRDQWFGMPPAH